MRRIPGAKDLHANGQRGVGVVRALGLAVPLLGVMLMVLAACGQTSTATPLAASQTFAWPMQGSQTLKDEVFDPAQITDAYNEGSVQLLYSGLVTLRPNLTVQPDLAQSIDISKDGLTYTFHLYPGIQFNDGTPIHSTDFAYAINRSVDPCVASPVSYYLFELKDASTFNSETCTNGSYGPSKDQTGPVITKLIGDSIQTPDSQTLVLTLGAPAAYFLEALTYPTSYPLEKSLLDKYPDGQWVMHLNDKQKGGGSVSGPFQVSSYTETVNGHPAVIYEPNPNWKDWHNPTHQLHITKIVRPFVFSPDTMYQEYRAGNYDYTDVPLADYPYARGQQDFYELEGLIIQYFGVNFDTPPFDSQTIRQAFDLGLNKQLMADKICQGGCIPTNHIVPQGMPGYYPNLTNPSPDGTQSVTGNQAQATKLMQQAIQTCHGPTAFPADPAYCPYVDSAHYSPLKEIDLFVLDSSETRKQFAAAAVDEWNSVFAPLDASGTNPIVVKLQLVSKSSFATYVTDLQNGTYGMWAVGWAADYPDPQDWLSLQFMSGPNPNNSSHVNSADLNKLMTKADREGDPGTRMQEYHQAEQQVVEMVPWIPYEQQKITWRQRTWVRGFSLNGTGSFADTSWPDVYIVQH